MMLSPDTELLPKPELVAEGWERRFMAGPARVKEVIQLYKEMGFEIHLEPVVPADLSNDCQGCTLATNFFVTIYTRNPAKQEATSLCHR
ncbi:MAG TPA: hypothetical protein VI451_22875 [Anaerolineales bacterium]|nr:hypothetical protein [Anaerolineales bacterium]